MGKKHKIIVNGKTVEELAKIAGLSTQTIYERISKNLPYEEIIQRKYNTPNTILAWDIVEATGLSIYAAYDRIKRKKSNPELDLFAPVQTAKSRNAKPLTIMTDEEQWMIINQYKNDPRVKACQSQNSKLVTAISLHKDVSHKFVTTKLRKGMTYQEAMGNIKQPSIIEQIKASPFYSAAIKMTPAARLFCGINIKEPTSDNARPD